MPNQVNNPDQELGYTVEEGQKYFANSDMGSAAALIVCGFELASLDKGDARKVKFVFKGREGITKAMDDYWNCKLPVDAQTYFNAIKRLKNQLRAG